MLGLKAPFTQTHWFGKVDVWNHVWVLGGGLTQSLKVLHLGKQLYSNIQMAVRFGLLIQFWHLSVYPSISLRFAYNIGIWIYLAFASWTARRFAF